jgi:predicted DNA-binding transcriptional regulator AlpA
MVAALFIWLFTVALTRADIATAGEIAALLKVTPWTIYNYTRRSTDPLPCLRIGGSVRFVRGEVEEWALRQRG